MKHQIRENIEIKVTPRVPGKGISRKLRRNSSIPSVLYGSSKENKTFSISEMDAVKYSSQKYENTIFTLKTIEDSEINNTQVLKKDTTIHPVTKRPMHIDFYAIDKTKTVRVNVEIQFTGKAMGEKEGGVFSALRRDVEIECLPTEIPKFFRIDISHLDIDDVLHVSDIKVPKNIKLITDFKETVATVSIIKEETKESVEETAGKPETSSVASGGISTKTGGSKTTDQKKSDTKNSPSSSKPTKSKSDKKKS